MFRVNNFWVKFTKGYFSNEAFFPGPWVLVKHWLLWSSRRNFTVKPDVLLIATLQLLAATLIIWLTVWMEQVATHVGRTVLFLILVSNFLSRLSCEFCDFYGSHISQSYHFVWEKGTNDCLVFVWCKTGINCRSCWIITTNCIQ